MMTGLSIHSVWVLLVREAIDARRSRWFWIFTLIFIGLASMISFLGQAGLGEIGVAGFARTTASLLNLVIIMIPIMGLLLGALSISLERDYGSLPLLMAQPVIPAEIIIGKWLGLVVSSTATLFLAFGFSGILIARFSGLQDIRIFILFMFSSVFLMMVHIAMGLFIGSTLRTSAMAAGVTLFLWLVEVLLGDVTLVLATLGLKINPVKLFWFLIINPIQAFRILVLHHLHGDLEYFGPVGRYAVHRFGERLDVILILILVGWLLLTLSTAVNRLRHRGAK